MSSMACSSWRGTRERHPLATETVFVLCNEKKSWSPRSLEEYGVHHLVAVTTMKLITWLVMTTPNLVRDHCLQAALGLL